MLHISGMVGQACLNSSSRGVDPGGSEVQDNIGYIVSLRSSWDKNNPVPKETNQNRNQFTVGLAICILDIGRWRHQWLHGADSLMSREVKGKNAS